MCTPMRCRAALLEWDRLPAAARCSSAFNVAANCGTPAFVYPYVAKFGVVIPLLPAPSMFTRAPPSSLFCSTRSAMRDPYTMLPAFVLKTALMSFTGVRHSGSFALWEAPALFILHGRGANPHL